MWKSIEGGMGKYVGLWVEGRGGVGEVWER